MAKRRERNAPPESPASSSAALETASSQPPVAVTTSGPQPTSLRRTITSTFFRHHGPRVTFLQERPRPRAEPVRQPAQVARLLALAHHLQRAIERGAAADQATLARDFGLTRARLTQVLDLLLLAPDLQAEVLELEAVDGLQPLAERRLRQLVLRQSWAEQRAGWPALVPTHEVRE